MSFFRKRVDKDLVSETSDLNLVERRLFNQVKERYKMLYPPPKKGRILPLNVIVVFVIGIATLLLAAARTWQAFFVSAGGGVIGSLEALFAIFAVEGMIVFDGYRRMRTSAAQKKRNERDTSQAEKYLQRAVSVAILISLAAGLYQSLGVIPAEYAQMTFVLTVRKLVVASLVIAMGIGATYLAHSGGQMIGAVLLDYEARKAAIEDSFRKAMNVYNANIRKYWLKSSEHEQLLQLKRERRRARTNKHEQTQTDEQGFASERTRTNKQANKPQTSKPRTNKRTNKRTNTNKRLLFALFDKLSQTGELDKRTNSELTNMYVRLLYEQTGEQLSERELSELVRKKKGYVSQTLKEWYDANKL